MKQQERNSIENDIKSLEKEIAITEKSKSYTLHWEGRILTLYGATRYLNQLKEDSKPKQLKTKQKTNEATRSKKRSSQRKQSSTKKGSIR